MQNLLIPTKVMHGSKFVPVLNQKTKAIGKTRQKL